jgi:hypothetical protein
MLSTLEIQEIFNILSVEYAQKGRALSVIAADDTCSYTYDQLRYIRKKFNIECGKMGINDYPVDFWRHHYPDRS